jgi:hypothetical protein
MTLADEANELYLKVAEHGVAVFLGPMAARRVATQTLDATTTATTSLRSTYATDPRRSRFATTDSARR